MRTRAPWPGAGGALRGGLGLSLSVGRATLPKLCSRIQPCESLARCDMSRNLNCGGQRLLRLLVCLWFLGCLVSGLGAEARYRAVLPGQTDHTIDLDGTVELTFTSYALTTHSLESSATLFMKVTCSERAEVLLDAGRVLPLSGGVILSPTPGAGTWERSTSGSTVWTFPLASPSPPGTNIIVAGDDPSGDEPRPRVPTGVGMPGQGNFMGVRIQRSGGWHYAWVHFGVREAASSSLPTLDLPTVLGFAYASIPDVPVEVGSKPLAVPIVGLELVGSHYLRIQWAAQIGQGYHIEARRHLDWRAWTPMSFRITGTAQLMTIDLPLIEETQFFRVIEAD
jgi:hypothetical protein